MERNVGITDRYVRMATGLVALLVAALLVAGVGDLSGTLATVVGPVVLALVGVILVVTGYTQTCPAYSVLGVRTLKP